MDDNKRKVIEVALGALQKEFEKDFGKNVIRFAGSQTFEPYKGYASGSIALDKAIGVGFPEGSIIELFGLEGSGKSFIAKSVVANEQKRGGAAAYFDVENAFEPTLSTGIGVNLDDLLFSQEQSFGLVMKGVEKFVEAGVNIIVVDSTHGLMTESEEKKGMGEQPKLASLASAMSDGLKKLVSKIRQSGSCVIFINQIRDIPGAMWGPTTTTPGGHALKFYANVRLEVSRTGFVNQGEEVVGQIVKVKVVKNRCGVPFRTAELRLLFSPWQGKSVGIDRSYELVDLAIDQGVIVLKGNSYFFGEQKLAVGREATDKVLEGDWELLGKISKAVK